MWVAGKTTNQIRVMILYTCGCQISMNKHQICAETDHNIPSSEIGHF